jgi:hypothetical protein
MKPNKLWHKTEKEWYSNFATTEDGKILLHVVDDTWIKAISDDYYFVESFGRTDADGKDVYVGDILEWTGKGCLWSDQVGKLQLIKDIRQLFGNINLFRVIGNVYENPELMGM